MREAMADRPVARLVGLALVSATGLACLAASLVGVAPIDAGMLWPSVAFLFAAIGGMVAGGGLALLLLALLVGGFYAGFGFLLPGFAVVGLEVLGLWLWLRLVSTPVIPLPLVLLVVATLPMVLAHVGMGPGSPVPGGLLARPVIDAQLLALSMLLVGRGVRDRARARWLSPRHRQFALVFLLSVLPVSLFSLALSQGAISGPGAPGLAGSLEPFEAIGLPLLWALVTWLGWRSFRAPADREPTDMPAAWTADSASARAPSREGRDPSVADLADLAGPAPGTTGFFVTVWHRAGGEWSTTTPFPGPAAGEDRLAGESLPHDQWLSNVHPGDGATHRGLLDSLARGEEASAQIRLNPSGEGWRWFHAHAVPMPVSSVGDGLVLYLDINSVKETERQLVQSSKMAVLGEMAAGVAHEINQPLNVIRLATQNLRRRIGGEPVEVEYYVGKLDRIAAQTRRAADIIDHMRVFGRKPSDDPEAFSPVRSTRRVVDLLQSQLDADGIRAVLDCEAEESMVWGYESLFEQVMMNLLVNARDAINTNATSDSREIFIVCSHPVKDVLELRVRDTGGGMPDAVRERLFQPFFTTKPAGKGTGLGLSLSYGIIQDMNGDISVRNVAGGAEFTLRLPLADVAVALDA